MSEIENIHAKLDRILALLEKPRPRVTVSGRGKNIAYSIEFEQVWAQYPRRAGSNPKQPAYAAFNQRLRAGATLLSLRNGTQRYRDYCDATGTTGSQYVLQASTFFGPSLRFEEVWEAPAPELKTPKTDKDWEEQAALKGLIAGMGESWDSFKQRIQRTMR